MFFLFLFFVCVLRQIKKKNIMIKVWNVISRAAFEYPIFVHVCVPSILVMSKCIRSLWITPYDVSLIDHIPDTLLWVCALAECREYVKLLPAKCTDVSILNDCVREFDKQFFVWDERVDIAPVYDDCVLVFIISVKNFAELKDMYVYRVPIYIIYCGRWEIVSELGLDKDNEVSGLCASLLERSSYDGHYSRMNWWRYSNCSLLKRIRFSIETKREVPIFLSHTIFILFFEEVMKKFRRDIS